MTGALRIACRWALTPLPDGLGADTIRWQAHVGNHASRAVAEKVGFTIQPGTVQGASSLKWSGQLRADTFVSDTDSSDGGAVGGQHRP